MATIIIVDAYSTGEYLIDDPELIKSGHKIIHIQSSKNPPGPFLKTHARVLKKIPERISKNLVFENTPEFFAILKAKYPDIIHVFPGAESGVLASDKINEHLQLESRNDFVLSMARRDKELMQDALEKAKLPCIPRLRSNVKKELLDWVKSPASGFDEEKKIPVVIKPPMSAATDNVHICYTLKEVENAIEKIQTSPNIFGDANQGILAQKFIEGTEYIVNTMSRDGVHMVTDIWVYAKKIDKNGRPIYLYEELLSPKEHPEIFKKLKDYTFNTLDALGIKNGPGHSEVMLTKNDAKPVLIETGARLVGGIIPEAYQEALGYTPISLMTEAYLNPEKFKARAQKGEYEVLKKARNVFFISPVTGVVKRDLTKEDLLIPHLQYFKGDLVQGEKVEKTCDFKTCPEMAYIISEKQEDLIKGTDALREREKTLYKELVNPLENKEQEEKIQQQEISSQEKAQRPEISVETVAEQTFFPPPKTAQAVPPSAQSVQLATAPVVAPPGVARAAPILGS